MQPVTLVRRQSGCVVAREATAAVGAWICGVREVEQPGGSVAHVAVTMPAVFLNW